MSGIKGIFDNPKKEMFSERDEKGNVPVQLLGLPVPKELHKAFKIKAAARSVTMSQAIQEAMEDWITKHTEDTL